MKAFLFLISIVLTSVVAITSADTNIAGTWVMVKGDDAGNPPVFHIRMGEGIWEGTMDIPGQQVYDRNVYRIKVNGDSVYITAYKDGSTIYARRVDEQHIVGLMKGETRVDTVLFKKY
ncbi:MAG TPA: hypothetical protein PLZ45_13615 [Ferruginibacter sp.]|nr:hypothetical protein [Ferruginibacter sp.]